MYIINEKHIVSLSEYKKRLKEAPWVDFEQFILSDLEYKEFENILKKQKTKKAFDFIKNHSTSSLFILKKLF